MLVQSLLYPPPENLKGEILSIPRTGMLSNPDRVIVLMKQLQDAVRNHYAPGILNYMSTVVLCEIHSQFMTSLSVSDPMGIQKNPLCSNIMDYIRDNLHQPLRVSKIAAHFGYNEKYLSHLFHTVTGISLKQYILSVKVDTASYMLTDSDLSISEIAHSLGFSDNHSFSKAYKKVSGISPSEYRNAFFKKLTYHI